MLKEYYINDNGKVKEYNKVKVAIERLQHFEPPEGYYLAFSGGKDSVVIYDLAVKAGVKFDTHYNITTIDPPELVKFIKQKYPDVQRHKPEKTMWQLIIENGPPNRLKRYCCRILKEHGGAGRTKILGVRWAESIMRKNRRVVESCFRDSVTVHINPILDWEDEDVWEYIRRYNISYCSLYDEGFKRLGCVMCPMNGTKGMLRHAIRWPKIYRQYLRTFEKMLEERRKKGWPKGWPTTWKTPEDIMHWWIYNPPKRDPDQQVIFE